MNEASPSATALVALMKLRGVGRRNALKIVSHSSANKDPAEYKRSVMARAEKARVPEEDFSLAWSKTEAELKKNAEDGIFAVSFYDAGYPSRLREIPDPPAVLFVKGDMSALHKETSVAIIGTREPTPYGEKVAQRSGQAAASSGFAVVSGLAHGCDTLAHQGCLEANGVGIAVMAHGLDKVYPAANRHLAADLLEKGGCLVSEYPVGMAPMRTAFAERDRIQSGLSDAVLVIETDVKGGTMHTVRFSREQHRPLACVAHPEKWLVEEKTRGNQHLIANGWAKPIADGIALQNFLLFVTAHHHRPNSASDHEADAVPQGSLDLGR